MATVIELHPDDVEQVSDPRATPHHPAGQVTAFDEETGLPIVRRSVEHRGTHKIDRGTSVEHSGAHNPQASEDHNLHPRPSDRADSNRPQGKTVSGRDVLHQSSDRAELVRQAKDHARQFEDGLKAATRGVAGARFDSVRDEKSPTRLDEKINKEKQPVETIPDLLAGRISVDSPEAHEKVAKSIGQHFSIVRDQNEFEDGDPEFGYRVHKIQVQVTPQLSGEVHIIPKEVLEANLNQHDAYKMARDGEIGKEGAADAEKARKEAKQINDEAMKRFNARNAETKYKFGSTQANIPENSEAHRSIRAAQALIDNDDLAGDGKNIDKPHVTLRYGLQGDDTKGVKDYLAKQPPFEAKLGKTASFPPSAHSDGAAPIIAPVESEHLHRMNREIAKHGDFKESDFPDYRPHATVAYVKPEAAEKYTGMDVTHGKRFLVTHVAISNKNGEHEEVPLGGKMKAEASDGKGKLDQGSVSGSARERSAGQSRFNHSLGADRIVGRPDKIDDRGSDASSVSGDRSRREDSPPRLARGVTVLIGDSHGIVRGGNPNFGGGGRWSVETPDGVKTFKGSELTPIARPKPKEGSPWIGYDLDKTLAEDHGWKGLNHIGKPTPLVEQAKKQMADGKDVRILTARVADDPKGIGRAAIEAWSHRVFGKALPVTAEKDRWFTEGYDDRIHQVEPNTGKVLS